MIATPKSWIHQSLVTNLAAPPRSGSFSVIQLIRAVGQVAQPAPVGAVARSEGIAGPLHIVERVNGDVMFPGNTSGIDPEKLVLVGSYIIYSGDIYVYMSIYIILYIYNIYIYIYYIYNIYIKELFTSADPVQEQKERIRDEM